MKNQLSNTPSTDDVTLLPRRQFLVLGSAAVAAAAATSLSADIVRTTLVIEDTAPRLSVGFTDATPGDPGMPAFAPRLTGAASLRSGDHSLQSGVRVRIHGVVRAAGRADQPVKLALDALYRVPGHDEAFPYLAWSYARLQGRTADSSSKSFVIPVVGKQPVTLALSSSSEDAKDGATLQALLQFTPGTGRRENKLRRGRYFVALCPRGMKAPDWRSVHAFQPENGSLPVLKTFSLTGFEPVPFDYIVFETDQA